MFWQGCPVSTMRHQRFYADDMMVPLQILKLSLELPYFKMAAFVILLWGKLLIRDKAVIGQDYGLMLS